MLSPGLSLSPAKAHEDKVTLGLSGIPATVPGWDMRRESEGNDVLEAPLAGPTDARPLAPAWLLSRSLVIIGGALAGLLLRGDLPPLALLGLDGF